MACVTIIATWFPWMRIRMRMSKLLINDLSAEFSFSIRLWCVCVWASECLTIWRHIFLLVGTFNVHMCIDTITLTFRTSGDEKFTKYAACKVRISSTKTKSTSTVHNQLILNIIHACASFSSMIYFFYVQPHYTSTNIHRRDSICVILYRRKHKHTRHSLQSAQQTTYIEKNVETKMFLEWPHACEREREANKQKTHTHTKYRERPYNSNRKRSSKQNQK